MSRISVLFLFILFLCISCGIPDEIPVLSKPLKITESDIEDFFKFKATEENGSSSEQPEFRGFEVYYKFFSINTDINTLENQSGYTTTIELTINGFRRITYYINDDECDNTTRVIKPLIKVPVGGTEASITINFKDENNVHVVSDPEDYISIPGAGTILPIRRGIEDDENSGFFKGFDTFKTSDLDVIGISNLDVDKQVIIMVYVLSYGIFDLSQPIYSDALCLGNIEILITVEE
jgi:hypothetical protein